MKHFSKAIIASIVTSAICARAEAEPIVVSVPAQTVWVDTGVDLEAGKRLTIMAGGSWTNGGSQPQWVSANGFPNFKLPGTLLPDAPLGALIGKVGSQLFAVGANFNSSIGTGGRLFLTINDTTNDFTDNQGAVSASISVLPSLASDIGSKVSTRSYVFIPALQVTVFGALALSGGRVQLSQTSAGTPKDVVVNGSSRSVMSYIVFGDFMGAEGLDSLPVELPIYERSLDQIAGIDSGGGSLIGQYSLTGSVLFVDRLRFLINNIHADFNNDLTVQLEPGALVLTVKLHSPDPTLRGEGNGYTSIPFGVPIPLGWEDGLCPDANITEMSVTLHLKPDLDTVKGELHLQDPEVRLEQQLSLSFGDDLIKNMKETLRQQFEDLLRAELKKPAAKKAIESAVTKLLLGGKENSGVESIKIDENGVETTFKK